MTRDELKAVVSMAVSECVRPLGKKLDDTREIMIETRAENKATKATLDKIHKTMFGNGDGGCVSRSQRTEARVKLMLAVGGIGGGVIGVAAVVLRLIS